MFRFIISVVFLSCGAYSYAQQQLPKLYLQQKEPDTTVFRSILSTPVGFGLSGFSKNNRLQSSIAALRSLVPKVTISQQTPIGQTGNDFFSPWLKSPEIGFSLIYDPPFLSDVLSEIPVIDE